APVQRAILAGDMETGVTIMRMEHGLDTGPMLAQARIPITEQTAGEVTEALAALGARLMVDVLERLPALEARPQPEAGVAYAHKIDKAEARIDWARPAIEIWRQVRAFQPSPGAWFEAGEERVKLIAAEPAEGSAAAPGSWLGDGRVATGEGTLRLVTVQPAGGMPMPAEAWARGRRLQPGATL
ncbi:MAG: methionyl-tRNA formyltransferase, partial [Sphingomonadaceae bacterium]